MAISSYNARLMKGTGTGPITWAKLIDIKNTPQIGGEPEMLETTTLTDNMKTFIAGLQNMDAMKLTANYTSADYDALVALANKDTDLAIWFGPLGTGEAGKFQFKGQITVFINETGGNAVVEMTVSIAPSTVITKVTT